MMVVGLRIPWPDSDSQNPEGVWHRGLPMPEVREKAGEGQVAPLCTWPAESCKISLGGRVSDYLAKFKEKQWEKVNKDPPPT